MKKKLVITEKHLEWRRLDGVISSIEKTIRATKEAHNLLMKELARQLIAAERERDNIAKEIRGEGHEQI